MMILTPFRHERIFRSPNGSNGWSVLTNCRRSSATRHESKPRSLCRLRQRSETLGQAVQLPGTRKVGGGGPGRCLVGQRGQRCCGVHRRDPAIKPKFIRLHRQLASFERLFERAVLAQQLRCALRSDTLGTRQLVRGIATTPPSFRSLGSSEYVKPSKGRRDGASARTALSVASWLNFSGWKARPPHRRLALCSSCAGSLQASRKSA